MGLGCHCVGCKRVALAEAHRRTNTQQVKMKLKIVQGREEIYSTGGMALIGSLLNGLESLKRMDGMKTGEVKKGQISQSGIMRCAAGLLCLGKTDYADIEAFRQDRLFRQALDLAKVPSEETYRQRLDALSKSEESFNSIEAGNLELLSRVEDFGMESTPYAKYTPIDADVSTQDNSGSRKEGVSWTYQNYEGYAPMFVYVGTYGYMLANELRPGSQHCQKGTPEIVRRCLEWIKTLKLSNPLWRFDAGNDDSAMSLELDAACQSLIIKRNLRKESLEQWLALARRVGEKLPSRDGKNVYIGAAHHIKPEGSGEDGHVYAVFEVTERLTDAKTGQAFLIPELEVNTWWTNLPEEPATVIELYHRHGTSEQYHSELKTDIGLERMPSGSFKTNDLFLRLGMLAFNALRIIGQKAMKLKDLLPLKLDVARRRLRSVMQDLIYIGAKLVRHARSETLKFGLHCPWFNVFREIHANI